MDNQEHGPNWLYQFRYILVCIVYGELLLLDCLLPWLSFLLRKLYGILTSSSVKVHMLVIGETFQAHETFIQKLKLRIELCSAESSNIILLFCPVVSRIGTDMEAAMARVTEDKPVILVFMHQCNNLSHMTDITVQPSRSNIVQVVHCAFHEHKGLLECQENEQAIADVHSALLSYDDSHAAVPQSKVLPTQSKMWKQPMATPDANRLNNPLFWLGLGWLASGGGIHPYQRRSVGLCASGIILYCIYRVYISRKLVFRVKVHVLVAGETFQTHETFIQKLNMQIELCSAESSNVILVFCPVVSRIGTDMEAAMARVTEDKPVILVFMHQRDNNPSHMTDITVQPSRRNIVQVVHCTFYEHKGLLECQENEQAVNVVQSVLLSYDDSHAAVPQSKVLPTQSKMRKQPMATPDANRLNNPLFWLGLGWLASGGVKVHVLVAGETFQAHETFIQKLKLQIEHCSAESSNVILVFCPVVSRIGTDMEAAMARVTENKPVILVFMHHCHDPSHMTNITVQPTESKIVQVVHCAFLENKGLLGCKENNQAVAAVRSELKKYK